MLAADRDLLAYEPNLFRDLWFLGQRRAVGQADVSEYTLTFYADDSTLADARVSAGGVIVVDGRALEVIERTDENEAIVSRVRDHPGDAAIGPAAASGAPAYVVTFGPQMRLVNDRILRALQVEPVTTPPAQAVLESQVINTDQLRAIVALGTLELVFSAGGSGFDKSHPHNQRSALYAELYALERDRAWGHIDTNGDGVPDFVRSLSSKTLVRG